MRVTVVVVVGVIAQRGETLLEVIVFVSGPFLFDADIDKGHIGDHFLEACR